MIDSSEVKLHFLDYWRVIKMRAGLILLVFLLVMVSAGVATYFMERQYFAKVSIEVKPDTTKSAGIFENMGTRTYDPQFVATQFQILRKSAILYPVIEQLELEKVYAREGPVPSRQQTFLMLNGDLSTQEVRNTGLIEVGVYNRDPQMAATIANTIARVYRDERLAALSNATGISLAQFKDEVDKQRTVVEKALFEAQEIRERLGIVDPDTESFAMPFVGTGERGAMSAEQVVNEQRGKVTELRTQMARIEQLQPEQLMEALQMLNIPDQTVTQKLPLLHDAKTKEAELLGKGLGENHPAIKALRAMAGSYREILAAALDGIRRASASKLQVAEETLSNLETTVGEQKKRAITDRSESGPYTKAKTSYIHNKKILDAAELRYSTIRMDRGIDIEPVKIWQEAEPPMRPAKPPVKLYIALSALVGLITGIGLAFFIEYLDTSVKTLDDVERYLQVPVLAVIPKDAPVLLKQQGDSSHAESYRILRANIEFNKPNRDSNTITLISGGPGEGKSTTLNNLAFTCAKGGYNVLVVDADLRRPTQQRYFEVENTFGLTDYLTGKATLDEITRTTKIDNLSFIPSGELPDDAVGILNSQRMTDLIQKLKQQYDLVFFDSPPILGVSDGAVLASEVDVTVMVVQHRRFPRAMLQRVKQAVTQVGGTLVGVVLNNVDTRHDDGYSYYNAYSEYYAPREKQAAAAAAAGGRRPANAPEPRTVASPNHGDY